MENVVKWTKEGTAEFRKIVAEVNPDFDLIFDNHGASRIITNAAFKAGMLTITPEVVKQFFPHKKLEESAEYYKGVLQSWRAIERAQQGIEDAQVYG